MAKIHVPGDGHTPPVPGGFEYLPYTDADKKKVVERALWILKHNVKGMKPCNDCFKKLPGGRTFDDILDDPDVYIHYDPNNGGQFYGSTIGKDVTVSEYSIRMGRWTVAATLVHEFAHVNGASGSTHDAEATLPCCGMQGLYNRTIIGAAPQQQGNTALA